MKERKKTSPIWRMPKEQLEELVKNSTTIGQILEAFGLQNKGGNPKTLKTRLIQDNIDFSHLLFGNSIPRSRHKFQVNKSDLNLALTENSTFSRCHLKKRLIEENRLEYKCQDCGLGNNWNDKNLVLVLDHINGVSNDNRIENLRFLCPNCNSQTATFAGKNCNKPKKIKNCKSCGIVTSCKNRCSNCAHKDRRKISFTKEELSKLIWEIPTTEIAKKYNVADTCINKWCKNWNIDKPPRGYWTKVKYKPACIV